jgi:hypothetical protein
MRPISGNKRSPAPAANPGSLYSEKYLTDGALISICSKKLELTESLPQLVGSAGARPHPISIKTGARLPAHQWR